MSKFDDEAITEAIIESIKSNSVISSSIAAQLVKDNKTLMVLIDSIDQNLLAMAIAQQLIQAVYTTKRGGVNYEISKFIKAIQDKASADLMERISNEVKLS